DALFEKFFTKSPAVDSAWRTTYLGLTRRSQLGTPHQREGVSISEHPNRTTIDIGGLGMVSRTGRKRGALGVLNIPMLLDVSDPAGGFGMLPYTRENPSRSKETGGCGP